MCVHNSEGLLQRMSTVIQGYIGGEFHGWSGETIITLIDGSAWQQVGRDEYFMYMHWPGVTIFERHDRFFARVDGADDDIEVRRVR